MSFCVLSLVAGDRIGRCSTLQALIYQRSQGLSQTGGGTAIEQEELRAGFVLKLLGDMENEPAYLPPAAVERAISLCPRHRALSRCTLQPLLRGLKARHRGLMQRARANVEIVLLARGTIVVPSSIIYCSQSHKVTKSHTEICFTFT